MRGGSIIKENSSSPLKVLFNSGIYSITNILQKGIGFFLLPIFTIYMTPEDYGITSIVNSFTQILSLLFTLSLNGAVQRYYYKYKEDWEKVQSFFGTIIIFITFNSVILSIFVVIFNEYLISPFIHEVKFFPYIFLGVLTVVFNPIFTIFQSMLQTMEKAKDYSKYTISNFLLLMSLNIIMIIVLKLGAFGQLLSALITSVIFGLISVFVLYDKKIIVFKFNFLYLKEALNYSVPLIPHLMSSSIANFISRVLLNNIVSTASAGIFNIGSQLMIIIDTFQFSINSAYIPWFYGIMGDKDDERQSVVKFADVLSKGYLTISIFVSLFIKEAIQILLPAVYLEAWVIIPIMLVAYQIRSIYLFFVNTLFYNTKATRYIFIASVSGSIVNVIFSSVFTDLLGLFTPAIAILLQWILVSFIVIILSRKIEPVDFKLNKMIFYVLYLIIVCFIGLIYDLNNPFEPIIGSNFIYKFIIAGISSLILWYKEIPLIMGILKNRKKRKEEK